MSAGVPALPFRILCDHIYPTTMKFRCASHTFPPTLHDKMLVETTVSVRTALAWLLADEGGVLTVEAAAP